MCDETDIIKRQRRKQRDRVEEKCDIWKNKNKMLNLLIWKEKVPLPVSVI